VDVCFEAFATNKFIQIISGQQQTVLVRALVMEKAPVSGVLIYLKACCGRQPENILMKSGC
jgi:hypothetical protein